MLSCWSSHKSKTGFVSGLKAGNISFYSTRRKEKTRKGYIFWDLKGFEVSVEVQALRWGISFEEKEMNAVHQSM